MAMVRSAGIDDGVNEAVVDGYRAVELAQRGEDATLVAAFAGLARALYFAGDLDLAWSAAARGVDHPDAAHRAPGHAVSRAILAMVAADRDRLTSARGHAEAARAIVGRISSSRSWLGATAAEALGAVLAAEGDLAAAEREFSFAERLVEDDIATVEHAWLLVRLADVRRRRGRLDEATVSLRRSLDELADIRDSGAVPLLGARVATALEEARRQANGGEILELPTVAELAVLRFLATRPLSTGDRRGAVPLSQHRPVTHSGDLSQAQRRITGRCGRQGGRRRPARRNAITQVIEASSREPGTGCENVSAWAEVAPTDSKSKVSSAISWAIRSHACGSSTRTAIPCSSARCRIRLS